MNEGLNKDVIFMRFKHNHKIVILYSLLEMICYIKLDKLKGISETSSNIKNI